MAAHVFLSYNTLDSDAALVVKESLEARGLTVFFDRSDLRAGRPWPQELERALEHSVAVAVCLGRHGVGAWQKREIWFALDRQVEQEKLGKAYPVIPILLPDADVTPGLLFTNTWIDLRGSLTDPSAMAQLIEAVLGGPAAIAPKPLLSLCPYRSLRSFLEEHSAFFFGRKTLAEHLCRLVLDKDVVTVLGYSGSGKSSIVQAGLFPKLRSQRPPAPSWDAIAVSPRDQPFHRLAAALVAHLEPELREIDRLVEAQKLGDALASGKVRLDSVLERVLEKSNGTDRLLLVIDPLDDLFNLASAPERRQFLSAIAGTHALPVTVLLATRADSYETAISSGEPLSDRIGEAVLGVSAMSLHELERVIVGPAEKVGLRFEPGLVERILEHVSVQPGGLPLLEFALTELWSRHLQGLVRHDHYDALGALSGALARRAEAEFEKFQPAAREICQRMFTRLVHVGRPGQSEQDTRRRARLSDVAADMKPVIRSLTDARLLITDRDELTGEKTVEIAHECLLHSWPRLREWLEENRSFLLWRQQLDEALAEWQRNQSDDTALLQGSRLDKAQGWLTAAPESLNDEEVAFIQRSSRVRSIEETMRQTQKLESLGVLAGGIAHDFNNLLVAILGNAYVALEKLPLDIAGRQNINDVVEAAERAAQLATQLLAYAGKRQMAKETVNLSALVRQIGVLVRSSVADNVELRFDLQEALPPVSADISQLQQVVMNLVINAAEAIGGAPGVVGVRTRARLVAGPETAEATTILEPGAYVCLEVSDTGVGMTAATKARIFEPFYTTKFTGRGLGLAAVIGIAKAHSGAIQVDSAAGAGSTFRLFLPAATISVGARERPVTGRTPLTGARTILFADDSEAVQTMAKAVLEHYGYRVVTAGDGQAAVDIFSANPDMFALVILDMVMPVMSGSDAAVHLKKIRPDTPILACTGHDKVRALEKFGKHLAGFIQKPFNPSQLAQKIADALDARSIPSDKTAG